MIGQPLTILMPARYRQAHERGLARIEATGTGRFIGSVVELHGLRKTGEEFPIELSLATWKTATGSYYSGIIRDISDRKKAALALEKLQHQHTLILTQAGEGIYGLDVVGNTTFVNPVRCHMLGYQVDELSAVTCTICCTIRDRMALPILSTDCPVVQLFVTDRCIASSTKSFGARTAPFPGRICEHPHSRSRPRGRRGDCLPRHHRTQTDGVDVAGERRTTGTGHSRLERRVLGRPPSSRRALEFAADADLVVSPR